MESASNCARAQLLPRPPGNSREAGELPESFCNFKKAVPEFAE
jgi:hypothetical protein